MKKLSTNLIQQNCYVRDVSPKVDVPSHNSGYSYISLDAVETEDGIQLRETVNSYDITPESVASYFDSTNYKIDPMASMSLPPRGQNLGDITALQALLNDPDAVSAVLEKIRSAQASQPVASDVDNSEVKNDE